VNSNPFQQLGLGTVQWGGDYGVSNAAGRTPPAEVARILAAAGQLGIRVLDTAALYGQSEQVLGQHDLDAFQIVTKTLRVDRAVIGNDDGECMRAMFEESLAKLRCASVYGLLIHNADDLLAQGGEILVRCLERLKSEGKVRKIGVSIYSGEQVAPLLARFTPDLVQVPISVLDQRLVHGGQLDLLKSHGVEIHARSVFLQGLLLMDPASTPPYFEPLRPLLRRWHAAARDAQMTPSQAALAFVRTLPQIDCVLVGVESARQLEQCASDFARGAAFDAAALACTEPAFINPSMWEHK
jgi:aryl-alcohol dehydrogenase-like predicted oxidoreductase